MILFPASDLIQVTVYAILVIACFSLIISAICRSKNLCQPPGPKGVPILGNIAGIFSEKKWEILGQYKEKYGDLVYLHGLGNSVLVLNSIKVIDDLLVKRSDVYSGRPELTVAGELMGLDQSTPLRQNDLTWKVHRKIVHKVLSPTAAARYHDVQEDLAILFCNELLTQPNEFNAQARLYAGRVVLTVTYGLPVKTTDSKYITHALETMDIVGKATLPGAYLCDLLPFLKYLPSWIPFQREAARGRRMISELVTEPLEHVKRDMAEGIAPASLAKDLLALKDEEAPDFEECVKWAAGSLYGAGAETTYATTLIFIMAMALHPDKQVKVQSEIDSVVGQDRFPRLADRGMMPYLNAVLKETMRWRPLVPLTLGRRTSEAHYYKDYYIPQGCMVVPNVWSIAFEKNEKYNPQEYIPERFLDPTHPATDPSSWAFGFGKRICPGKGLAEASLFVVMANLLWAFKIAPPASGQLRMEFSHKLISYPKPFSCQMTPRSEAAAALLRARAAEAKVNRGLN